MTYRLQIRPQAKAEIALTQAWYEQQSPGLSLEFMRAVDAALAAIERHPFIYPRVHGNVRRAPLRRFPYRVIFTVDGDEVIVLGCLHNRRGPRSWQGRS